VNGGQRLHAKFDNIMHAGALAWCYKGATNHISSLWLRTLQRCLSGAGSNESKAAMLVFDDQAAVSCRASMYKAVVKASALHCHRSRKAG
jgi:hypothetical protein